MGKDAGHYYHFYLAHINEVVLSDYFYHKDKFTEEQWLEFITLAADSALKEIETEKDYNVVAYDGSGVKLKMATNRIYNKLAEFGFTLIKKPVATARFAGDPEQSLCIDSKVDADYTSIDINKLDPIVRASLVELSKEYKEALAQTYKDHNSKKK